MDEAQNDPQLAQLDEVSPAPSPADDAKADAAEVNAGSGRFAVYDKAELRFRGKVHGTRKAADAARAELAKPKGVSASRFVVKEV